MVYTHNMPTRHCQRTSRIACNHRHLVNSGFPLLPGAYPQQRFIDAKVHNVDTGETQVVHFDRCYCSQYWRFDTATNTLVLRIIDLLEWFIN